MLCDNMGVVLACEKGRWTDPVLLRILRRLAAITLASGARFRYRWVPSELCPSDEASRWYDREQEVLEESRREPRFATKRRSSQDGDVTAKWCMGSCDAQGQKSRPRPSCRARLHLEPLSVSGVNTGSTRSHLEQASVKATTLHNYQQHYAEWMRWCRQYQKNLSTPVDERQCGESWENIPLEFHRFSVNCVQSSVL